ncbi:MAG: sugar phosphate isomerase/epimerase [Spirochaetes bacterium]|nr:sugar phosphate isomerase/epimerase [Spirochaetota bacterium]
MRISYSELCLIGGSIESNVERLRASGAEEIELILDGAGWDSFEIRMARIAASLKSMSVDYSIHVPVWDLNLVCENAAMRVAVLEAYKKTIEFGALLGARHIVLHTGWSSDRHFSKEKARERAKDSIEALSRFNEDFSQLLLVENIGGPGASLFTQDQFAAFLEGCPEDLGYIVDIGHANLNGWDLGALFPALGARLRALHLHDNDGRTDSHLPLCRGCVDWKKTLDLVAELGTEPTLILEYNIGTELKALEEGKAFLKAWMDDRARLAHT